jgi:anti-sigma B factor antagonist
VTSKLDFSGELDLASAASLQKAIHDAMHEGADSLTLDMRGVTFIDSVGLSLIVTARNRLDEDGGQLRVVLPERLRPLFDLSGLLEVLDVQFVAD